MKTRRRRILFMIMAFALSAGVNADRAADRAVLSYDLAFAHKEFPWQEEPAVSPDGAWVAYSLIQPVGANRDARYQPNGTPSSAVGSRIFLQQSSDKGAQAREVCPKSGSCWRPAWSPDSRRIAFYSDADGTPRLWVYALGEAVARRVSAAIVKPKLWIGDEPVWSPDGRELFVPLAPEQRSVEAGTNATPARTQPVAQNPEGATVTVFRAGREVEDTKRDAASAPTVNHFLRENNAAMAAIDVASGEARVIVPAEATPRPSVLRLSPSGRWLSYLSVFKEHGVTSQRNTMDLTLVPSRGGPVTILAEDLPLYNDYHRLNYSWHPTEDRLVYLKDNKLWLVDLRDANPSPPRQFGAQAGDLAPSPLWFTRNGNAVVVGANVRDEKDYADPRAQSLAVAPLDGGEPRILKIGDGWDYRGILKANATTVWQPDEQSVTVLLQERATGESAVARFPLTGDGSKPTILWKGLARIANLTGGGQHDLLVGRYQDIGTPPGLYKFGADFSAKTRVVTVEPRFESLTGGRVEIFESTVPLFDGSLGRVRTAALLPPGARRGDKLPAIVLMYPGGDVSSGAEEFGGGNRITVPTQVFTSRGYAVIYPNLKLGPNGEAGNPAREMTDVLLPQVYRAAELGYIDLNRVGIAGQSYGGYGTAAIISHTNLFRAAVAISGIYDLPGTYGDIRPDGTAFWIGWAEGGQARMGTHPWANLRRYLDNSPYYQADKIRTPLLIVHGDADMAYHDAEKLFSALRRLDRTVQLAAYHGQGHVVSSWTLPNAMDAAKRMVEFYQRYLGASGSVTPGRQHGKQL